MGVINMAHGELIMIGAYTTYVVQNLFRAAYAARRVRLVPARGAVPARFVGGGWSAWRSSAA
jgi:branched-subunit amino acid ABC-type transport system permease component